MQATIDSTGHVHIHYNMQAESLEAPGGLYYLPCDGGCGQLLKVEKDVVSSICDACDALPITPTYRATVEGGEYDGCPLIGDGEQQLVFYKGEWLAI